MTLKAMYLLYLLFSTFLIFHRLFGPFCRHSQVLPTVAIESKVTRTSFFCFWVKQSNLEYSTPILVSTLLDILKQVALKVDILFDSNPVEQILSEEYRFILQRLSHRRLSKRAGTSKYLRLSIAFSLSMSRNPWSYIRPLY